MEGDAPSTTSDKAAPPAASKPPSQRHQRAVTGGLGFLLQQMRSASSSTAGTTTATTTIVKEVTIETAEVEKPKRVLPSPSTVEYSRLSGEESGELRLSPVQVVSACFRENTTPAFGFAPNCPENNYVRSCRFSPTGNHLVCDSEDRIVRIFNVEDEKLTHRTNIRTGGLIYSVVWDPYGEFVATTSGGSPIQLWSVDGEKDASYHAINHLDELDSAYCMAYSRTGDRIYAGHRGVVRRFEVERPGRQLSDLKTYVKGQGGQKSILSCIAMSPAMDGVFAVGSFGGGVGLYSDFTNSCDLLLPTETRFVSCLQYSANGQKIFIGGRNTNTIECFDIRMAKLLATFSRKTNTNQRYGFQIDSAERFLFAGDSNGRLLGFDLAKPPVDQQPAEAKWTIPASASAVSDLSLHPHRSLLASTHGQRVFPLPLQDDSDEENRQSTGDYTRLEAELDNSIKLWKF